MDFGLPKSEQVVSLMLSHGVICTWRAEIGRGLGNNILPSCSAVSGCRDVEEGRPKSVPRHAVAVNEPHGDEDQCGSAWSAGFEKALWQLCRKNIREL